MKKKLNDFLQDELMVEGVISDNENLFAAGLDSLGIMSLVNFIEINTGITIDEQDLVLDNFNSIDSLQSFINNHS